MIKSLRRYTIYLLWRLGLWRRSGGVDEAYFPPEHFNCRSVIIPPEDYEYIAITDDRCNPIYEIVSIEGLQP